MIAVRIGPDLRMAVVGAPSYFEKRPRPKKPQDLTAHRCINLRLPTYGGLYAWEFEKGGRDLKVRVDGQLVFNTTSLIITAALAGSGLACLPQDEVQAHIADGRLIRVLGDWCPPFSGYHHRRRPSPCWSGCGGEAAEQPADPGGSGHHRRERHSEQGQGSESAHGDRDQGWVPRARPPTRSTAWATIATTAGARPAKMAVTAVASLQAT